MKKIVINISFGGFNLDEKSIEMYSNLSGINLIKSGKHYSVDGKYFSPKYIKRDDPFLIKTVEILSPLSLKIVEIPKDVDFIIQDYDGQEWVAEKHRVWR